MSSAEADASAALPPSHVWPLHNQLRWIFSNLGLKNSGVMPDGCAAKFGDDHWHCMFLEHLVPVVAQTVPLFVLQSRFDTSNFKSLPLDSSQAWQPIEHFGIEVSRRLHHAAVSSPAPVGYFLDACLHHCMKWNDIVIENVTSAVAFAKFLDVAKNWHEGRREYTDNTILRGLHFAQVYNTDELPCGQCHNLGSECGQDIAFWRKTFSEPPLN